MLLPSSNISLPPSPASQALLNTTKVKARALIQQVNKKLLNVTPADDSLVAGSLGLAIYYFSLYRALGEERYAEKGIDIFYGIFDRLNSNQSMVNKYAYSNGICGLNASIDMLIADGLLPTDLREETKQLDEILFAEAKEMIGKKQNDFLHSSLGILSYFGNKLPDQRIEPMVNSLLDQLFEQVNETVDFCWLPNIVTADQDGSEINLSLSHGQCSFLIVLLNLLEKGVQTDRLEQLVVKGVQHTLSYRKDIGVEDDLFSVFPNTIRPAERNATFLNRLAWCYGDLNEVYLLYKAGIALGQIRYTTVADLVGAYSTTRSTAAQTLCTDSHFCHGSAGLAQFYNTLFQLQPIDAYRNSYYYWINETIDLLEKELVGDFYRSKEADLLEGMLGPALTLLSFAEEKSMLWPRLFLLENHQPLPL